ncbi:MAG: bifunctional nicotinamidase/pyrazinamidase [Rhabdochlamydiaceae bacterium]|nr:bifunctional nicotinamidase/pyrazinamidase [Candidatus Amphrikana amoebophyrae]
MRKALLIVDVQNDFLPGGSLEVPESDEIIPIILELVSQFETVIATQDFHPVGHCSFASTHKKEVGDCIEVNGDEQVLWPDHCIQGTKGVNLHQSILDNVELAKIVQKGTNLKVDSYSAFFDNDLESMTDLDEYLDSEDITHLSVVGLATDYCVKNTVLDALDLGYKVSVILEGCRAVNLYPEDEEEAIKEMAAAGAQIIC